MDCEVKDYNARVIVPGVKVNTGLPYIGMVIEVTDPDGDVNNEGYSVMIAPKIKVAYDVSCTEVEWFSTRDDTRPTWANYPDGPDVYTFVCDDLEVTE